jgi:hypothetical protein
MVAEYAYPEQRIVDIKFLLVPNTAGTSSAFNTPQHYFSEPTGMEGYPQPATSGRGSAIELLINRAVLEFSSASLFIIRDRTSTANQDYEMSLLEAASSMGNEGAFAEVANSIKWENRAVEDYLKALRLALSVGAHMQARKLAAEGGLRFSDNIEMQKFSRILAPSVIVNSHLPPDLNAAADMRWLKAHRDEYSNQWVALQGGILLAAAPTRIDLLTQLENPKDKTILISPVY